jgi:hypothetical protein
LEQGKVDKVKWLKKNTTVSGSKINIIRRPEKKQYAIHKGVPAILIDDHPKNIAEWEQAGGVGIHHKSAANTIRKLKALGF